MEPGTNILSEKMQTTKGKHLINPLIFGRHNFSYMHFIWNTIWIFQGIGNRIEDYKSGRGNKTRRIKWGDG